MDQVHRADDEELCGHVDLSDDGRWVALTVFGGELGRHEQRASAVEQVLREGLASLADRWTLRPGGTDSRGESETVCIQEANGSEVTVAVGYYSMPGVPTLTIPADQLRSGEWILER